MKKCKGVNVFISGARGYIGSSLLEQSLDEGFNCAVLVRENLTDTSEQVKQFIGDLSDNSFVRSIPLNKVDVFVHAAAKAHVIGNRTAASLSEYLAVNRDATLFLAHQAAEAGVKRFVFVSTIGVNGKHNSKPFTEDDKPHPHDAYSFSKYQAELGLLEMARKTEMEVVIIRPPLVYGKNAPGNFGSLVRWIRKGVPLPFGAVHNQRSVIALDNLVDFILLCADRERSPNAANEVFLVSDGDDISTSVLLREVAKAQGRTARLISVPVAIMKTGAHLLGKGAMANSLFGNLQIDSSKARELLGWRPVITMEEQLKKMFQEEQKK